MAGRENHTLDFAVTDPQHIHEEMDHAYATFHQLTRTASHQTSTGRLRVRAGRISSCCST